MSKIISLADRIQILIEKSKLSIPKFAAAIGAKTPQGIREILKGKTKTLSGTLSEGIMKYFDSIDKEWELNAEWLLFGEGDMMLPTHTDKEFEDAQNIPTQILMIGLEDSIKILSKQLNELITKLHEDVSTDKEERKQFLSLLNAQQQTIAQLTENNSRLTRLVEAYKKAPTAAPGISAPAIAD